MNETCIYARSDPYDEDRRPVVKKLQELQKSQELLKTLTEIGITKVRPFISLL
jgi:hypothetical protein